MRQHEPSGSRAPGWYDGFVERLLPSSMSSDELPRARLFVKAWLPVLPFCLIAGAWFTTTASWGMVTTLSAAFVLGLGMLWLLRVTGRLNLVAHTSLLIGTLLFAGSGLTQTPPDPTAPTVVVVIPLAAAFVLGTRAGWAWLVIASGIVVGALFLVSLGVSLPYRDEFPLVTQTLNFVYAMIIVLVFAQSADQMRARVIEEQRAAARTKSRFLANISHEIRTPMHGVLGMTDELLGDDALPSSAKERIAVIQRSGQQLVTLINDLLDLSKIEAGKLSLLPTATDLRQLVGDVAALFEPLADKKGLAFVATVADDAPQWIAVDGVRLKQVLTNLVNNAVKFTEQGEVRLAVTCASNAPLRLRFEVRDTGVGISRELLPRLFTAFEQGDPSTTRRYEGTGLGLALSKQLVALLGGQLTVISVPGRGATFGFELDVRGAEEPAERAWRPPALTTPLDVLVVDDNAVNRRVAEGLLQRAGYRVQSVTNGQEALDALQRTPFAAVLMDCHMPVMDGFEATERIRRLDSPLAQTPVIALTASASSEDREACRRAGMNECLAKPVSYSELVRVLGELSGPPRQPPG
ncbi:MAG: ATP-binding protein [Myxococcaceae bacterium]|nr:ATP-binding protein [Myxococcaceae bacterium]